MAKDISPAEIAANQKCDLFALIFQEIEHNPLLLNENLEMKLKTVIKRSLKGKLERNLKGDLKKEP